MLRGRRRTGRLGQEDGAALVEFGLSAAVMFTVLIGLFQVCLAMYTYLFVDDAAREASRWAMVRGSLSCTNSSSTLPSCGATQANVLSYVKTLQYPAMNANNLSVNVSWLKATVDSNGDTTWASCASGTCNAPGNIIKVQVKYQLPLYIPFWKDSTVNIGSTSAMVISQ